MKKTIGVLLVLVMIVSLFTACRSSSSTTNQATTTQKTGAVYYLNFKPEQDEQWQDLAEDYTEKTGVPVTVITAASGAYEETLMSEMAKTTAPTLFQVNGPVGLQAWQDYCYDLSGTDVYQALTSDEFALAGDNGEVYGIAYAIETYGLICNTALLKQAGYEISDITDFASLKKVAEDITARSKELGFSAFTSAGMDGSSDWRFKTHLANLPLYYEFQEEGYTGQPAAIKGTYLDQYKQVWDLYIQNATCSPAMLSAKTGDEALAEFCTGEAVFYQNGTWAWGDEMEDYVGQENLWMYPVYIGVENEQTQGLCTGSENYWCVNKHASQADIQATLDFLSWVVTSREGTDALADEMGFVSPFAAAKTSDNPLVKIADQYLKKDYKPVAWTFSTIPSETWKNGVGSALTEYAQGTGDWDAVEKAFVDGWASEYAASHR